MCVKSDCAFALQVSLLVFVFCGKVFADDIEVYLPNTEGIYLHVLMDLGDADLDKPLCTLGDDCQPPFMSKTAFAHLSGAYAEGAAVTAPGIFRAVLAAVVSQPQFDDLNVSVMISNHHDNAAVAAEPKFGGGTVLQGYQPLRSERDALHALLLSLPVLGGAVSHQLQPKESYLEWLRYIRGKSVALGSNTSGNFGLETPLPDFDDSLVAGDTYAPGVPDSQQCPRLYSILFTQGDSRAAGFDEDLNEEISREVTGYRGSTFESLMESLHGEAADLIPAREDKVTLQRTWVATSRSRAGAAIAYAAAGGGDPVMYVDDPLALEASMSKRLSALVVGDAVLSSISFVPDSSRAAGVLRDVFFPMFQTGSKIDWHGNLKKLKLEEPRALSEIEEADVDAGRGESFLDELLDARGEAAFDVLGVNRGQLKRSALSFWTDPLSLAADEGELVDVDADGAVVTRGGAGQKIDGVIPYRSPEGGVAPYFIGDTNGEYSWEGFSARQLFYESEPGVSLLPFNADIATVDAMAAELDPEAELSLEERLDLVRWGRGQAVDYGAGQARDWVLGAVVHSQPLAINYGATEGYSRENPNVRLFFGSADGLFHMIENTDSSGNETGRERFAFYPKALLSNLLLRKRNLLPALQHLYGVDGAPVALTIDQNDDGTLDHSVGDKAYVYFGLRRGGNSYYALDVSEPDALPRLLWKIDGSLAGEFADLGLSFSKPFVGKVAYGGAQVDVLVFGGGYDGGWNSSGTARVGKDAGFEDDTQGNAIYIVNARTGALIWKAVRGITGESSNRHYEHAGLADSIPSAVSALRTPDGFIHRLYVADTGGAVWRVDVPKGVASDENHRRDNWFITKLADLGADVGEKGGAIDGDRRFFHAPDIVRSFDAEGEFDGILIQSGDRAHPSEKAVQNYLFYIKDRLTVSGSALVAKENVAGSPKGRFQFDDLRDPILCSTDPCDEAALRLGWKLGFAQPGEKGLAAPLVDGGRVFATTFVPGKLDRCASDPGSGFLYVVQLADAAASVGKKRFHDLGPGIPNGTSSVADLIYIPGAGIDLEDSEIGDGETLRKLIPSTASTIFSLYWREPAIDPL